MHWVRTEQIRPGMRLGKTIVGGDGRVLLTAGTTLRESLIEPLTRQGVAAVYVINELAPDVAPQDVVADETRQALKQEMAGFMNQMGQAFAAAARKGIGRFSVGLDIRRLEQSVGRVVDEVMANPEAVYHLQDIRTADEYTLGHCVNVCILATLVGTALELNYSEAKDLALGALLHDVGKILTPREILNKLTPLTTEEFNIIREHTTIGWNMLKDQAGIPYPSAIVALQHHERWLGGGYPAGLRGEQIFKYSRVCALADCFDALTADRVYRKGASPARALEIMQTGMQGFFQPELFECFLQCVAPFPVGSLVEITGGRRAVVVAVPRGKTLRPRIRILLGPDGSVLPEPVEMELVQHPEVEILALIRESADSFSPEALHAAG